MDADSASVLKNLFGAGNPNVPFEQKYCRVRQKLMTAIQEKDNVTLRRYCGHPDIGEDIHPLILACDRCNVLAVDLLLQKAFARSDVTPAIDFVKTHMRYLSPKQHFPDLNASKAILILLRNHQFRVHGV